MVSTEPTAATGPCDPGSPEGNASPAAALATAEEVARTMPEEATPAGMKAVLKEKFGELKRDWDAMGPAGQDEVLAAGAKATEAAKRDEAAADAREGETPPPEPKPPPPVDEEPAPAPAEDKEAPPAPAADPAPAEADADGEDYHDKFKRETEKMGIVWQPAPDSEAAAPMTPPNKKQRVEDGARVQTEDEKRTQDDVNKGWGEEQESRETLAGGKTSKPASPARA